MTSKQRSDSRSGAGKTRPPLLVRLTARASIFSLVIAVAALLAANLQAPIAVTASLKLVFIAAATTAGASLILWAACSGLHFIFRDGGERRDGPPHAF